MHFIYRLNLFGDKKTRQEMRTNRPAGMEGEGFGGGRGFGGGGFGGGGFGGYGGGRPF